MLRKGLCLALTALLLFSLSGCGDFIELVRLIREIQEDDRPSGEEMRQFVLENEDYLLQCIQAGEPEKLEGYGIIKSVYESGNYIEFSCEGSGFGSQTNYAGLFYSKNGNMNAARPHISPEDMIQEGNGYLWEQPEGDNTYYVEHICGRFYYYLEHY